MKGTGECGGGAAWPFWPVERPESGQVRLPRREQNFCKKTRQHPDAIQVHTNLDLPSGSKHINYA